MNTPGSYIAILNASCMGSRSTLRVEQYIVIAMHNSEYFNSTPTTELVFA